MDINLLNIVPVILFFVSFFGLITGSNIIKSIAFILLMQSAAVMAWIVSGSGFGRVPPIILDAQYLDTTAIADPLPQALMITAIVIGVAVVAVNIVMLNSLIRKYGTAEWKDIDDLARENKD